MLRTTRKDEDEGQFVGSQSSGSGVVEPVACLSAMDSMKSVVPGDIGSGLPSLPQNVLPSRREGMRRFVRALQTGLPLAMAENLVAVFVLTLSAWVAGGFRFHLSEMLLPSLAYSGLYFATCQLLGQYPATGRNPVCVLRRQTYAIFCAGVGFVFLQMTGTFVVNSLSPFLIGIAGCVLILPLTRSMTRSHFARYAWWGERAIVVGTTRKALAIFDFLDDNIHLGLRPIGVVDDHPAEYWVNETNKSTRFLGVTSELREVCQQHDCHWVLATTGGRNQEELERFLKVCCLVPNLIVVHDNVALPSLWSDSFDAAGMPAFRIKDRLLHPMVRACKRLIDIILSACFLFLAAPLLAFITMLVKITSPGPTLYADIRIGRGGEKIRVLKFRTMVANANEVFEEHLKTHPDVAAEWAANQKLVKDPRIIPVIGQFLRRSSLDELPQLWNVLRGDMSLVGPRPIMLDEAEKYGDVYPLYTRVRPGLTGLWQVSGRNRTSYEARLQLNAYYVRSWSLWLDYYILLRTIKTVLTGQGSC